MSNLELHLVRVSQSYESQSTVGSDRIDTIHQSEFTADKRLYRLKIQNQIIRFIDGHAIACVVIHHKQSGVYYIVGFVNFDNESHHFPGLFSISITIAICGILLIPIFGIGLILLIWFFGFELRDLLKIKRLLAPFLGIELEKAENLVRELNDVKTKIALN